MLLHPHPHPHHDSPQLHMAVAAPASTLWKTHAWPLFFSKMNAGVKAEKSDFQRRVKNLIRGMTPPDFHADVPPGRHEGGTWAQQLMQIGVIRVAEVLKSLKQVWLTTLATSAFAVKQQPGNTRGINDTPARMGDAAMTVSYTCVLKSARPSWECLKGATLNEYIHVYIYLLSVWLKSGREKQANGHVNRPQQESLRRD